MIAFIDDHRGEHGVEPICRVLPAKSQSDLREIAPSTYHAHAARRADPGWLPVRAQSDAALMVEIRRVFEANFCVDSPDGCLGNVRHATIAEIWNGERAHRFRARRRQGLLGACHRCVARHMAEIRN